MRLAAFFVATALLSPVLLLSETVDRRPNESLADFAARVIPKGTELAHRAIQGAFGPSKENVVILYHKRDDIDTNYAGWVLTPEGEKAASYRKYELPPMKEIPKLFEITVSAVMFAAISGPEPDLIVLYEYYRNGSGKGASNAAYAYHWNGEQWTLRDDVSQKLAGLKDAAAVRRKLKSIAVPAAPKPAPGRKQ